jgi:hypothetical protein
MMRTRSLRDLGDGLPWWEDDAKRAEAEHGDEVCRTGVRDTMGFPGNFVASASRTRTHTLEFAISRLRNEIEKGQA